MTNEPDMPDDERPSLGEEIISWIEANCRVPEGALVGQPVVLMQWQRNAIIEIYDNRVPTQRAIISVGRKSGKTVTAAFLLLYSTAQSRDQTSLSMRSRRR
jgi:phage terminase large subunit-like protein